MQADIDQVLIDRQAIARRVDELARQIVADLEPDLSRGEADLTLVPILTGSIIFVADLIRHMPLRMRISVMSITSYPGKATSSRGASVEAALTRLPESLAGHHVLLIDDILDSGNTLRLARQIVTERQPDSFRTCVLLRKKRDAAMATPCDYVAFDIPDQFVVGYGLDFDDLYRNLPEICTLRQEVAAGATENGRC
jgi:hypoxanthine phosphoribosyltransferase